MVQHQELLVLLAMAEVMGRRPIKSVKCWRMFSGGEGICLGRIGAITCSPW